MLKTKYLSKQALINLKNYKYQASEYSPLETYVLQHWWNWIVNYLPMWLAPNLVTLSGLAILSFSNVLIYPYDLSMKEELPW